MTAREVVMCTERISDRKYKEATFNANIHGAKLKNEASSVKKVEFSKEQDEILNKISESALDELTKRRDALNGKRQRTHD